jgi:hypothetical protein
MRILKLSPFGGNSTRMPDVIKVTYSGNGKVGALGQKTCLHCRQVVQEYFLLPLFPCLPWAQSIYFLKKIDAAKHTFRSLILKVLGLYSTHKCTGPRLAYQVPKCIWAATKCVCAQTHLVMGRETVREERCG